MRIGWVVLSALLTACGSGGEESASANNHGYGFAYDAQGVTGLRLRYTPVLPANDLPLTDPAYYETQFAETERCTGLSAPAPFVIWDPLTGQGFGGLYYSNPSLVVLATISATRHEFVHYLLDVNGDPDHDHRSPLFRACGAG